MLLDAGRAQDAVDLLGPLLASHPDDGALLILNAYALIELERYTEAMASAKRASELAPAADEPHRIASVVLGKVGDVEGSARAAREAVRLAPDEPAAWERVCIAVGTLLDELGRSGDRAVLGRIREVSEEVLVAADRVVALAPTEGSAYAARGYALACARRPGQAKEAYARAQQLDPDGAISQQALGNQPTALPSREEPQQQAPQASIPDQAPEPLPQARYQPASSAPPPPSEGGGGLLTGRWGTRLMLMIAIILAVTIAVSFLT